MMSSGSSGDASMDKAMKVSVISGHANQVAHVDFLPWFVSGRLYHNLTDHGKMVDHLPYQVPCFWLVHALVYILNLFLCQKQSRDFRCFQITGNRQLPEQQRPCHCVLVSRIHGILYVKQNSSIRLLVRTRLQIVQVYNWI